MILTFDIFINNFDRFPLLWENEGNPNNLIVKMHTDFSTKSKEIKD